jgi:hypothetical protein
LPWLRRLIAGLSPRRLGIAPGSVDVGFVVIKVTVGPIFLRVLRFSSVNIIPPWQSIPTYTVHEQYALWWPQFRDIVSFHRREQRQGGGIENIIKNSRITSGNELEKNVSKRSWPNLRHHTDTFLEGLY